jgi:adenylate cyclase
MRGHRFVIAGLIAAASAATASLLVHVPQTARLLEPMELTTLDWRARSAERPAPELSPVALVLFDSASVAAWPYLVPFPRGVLADLLDVVAGTGPRAIALDVFLDRLYPELDALGGGDDRLREAIARAGNVALVAATEEAAGERRLLAPHPFFSGAAAAVATADLPTPYETVRDGVLAVRTRDGLVPGLALALHGLARDRPLEPLLQDAERSGAFDLPSLPRPYRAMPREGRAATFPLVFLGPPSRPGEDGGAFPAFSASTLLQLGDLTPPEWFRDRVVLIGTGFHSEDRFRTPFAEALDASGGLHGWTYGTEVHATAVENLLSGRHLNPLDPWSRTALALLLAVAVAGATFAAGAGWGAAAAAGALAATTAGAWWAFAAGGWHLPLVEPVLAAGFALLGSTGYVSIVEGRQKRMIRRAFGRYVPPAVVAELVADPDRLVLGGEKREVSILFSDLAGFTALSERADPVAVVALLNEYLDAMTRTVLEEGGTLDKYIGDAVMALFGAPLSLPDHAARACRAAVRMQLRMAELNTAWAARGLPPLRMRVGINTGSPVVGNIGGRDRFDYTALGDPVNIAARLETACKTYGVGIIVSEATRASAASRVRTRELDRVGVYGRTEPVTIFELLAADDRAVPGVPEELIEPYELGLGAFRRHDFEMAASHFEEAAELKGADGPTRMYLERCARYAAAPPPRDRDLVERWETK